MPTREQALPGREERMAVPARHEVLGTPLAPPFPPGLECAMFAMGCFWGAEKVFWTMPEVFTTAVGYAAGLTPHPTYEEVCTGLTGHAEVVLVVFDPKRIAYTDLLRAFWEHHDPTQGMRQGNDVGTQYRSGIYAFSAEQRRVAQASRDAYQRVLTKAGYGRITTEILDVATGRADAPEGRADVPEGRADVPGFYYAEAYHQQYLAKNPWGYCGHGGTGVSCPAGLTASAG